MDTLPSTRCGQQSGSDRAMQFHSSIGLYAFSRVFPAGQKPIRSVAKRPSAPIFSHAERAKPRSAQPSFGRAPYDRRLRFSACLERGGHISSTNASLNQTAPAAFVLRSTVLAQIARGLASQVLQLRPALRLKPFAIVAIRPVKNAQG